MGLQIFRLNGLLLATGDVLTRPTGQTSARWQVLGSAEDAPVTVAQIARGMGLARQSVQRVADLLVRDRLAVYRDNPHHRRARLLALTPRGRAVLRRIQEAQRVWADAIGAEVGEAELGQASRVLERLLHALAGRRGARAAPGRARPRRARP